MLHALVLALFALIGGGAPAGQAVSALHIRVVLLDDERNATPVPRHVLLVSENPASATPRRIVTGPDGTATVRLRPGNYTVESDRPVALSGKAYQWTQNVDVVAGRDATLDLTAENAEIAPVAGVGTETATLAADPSFLLPRWQASVVALWTPTTHASGFVVDAAGLVATNQRVIGAATSVEVQLSPTIKVAARVLAADPARDVAIIWIDPKVVAAVRPMSLGCAEQGQSPVTTGQELFTIGAPRLSPKGMASGIVRLAEAHTIVTDVLLERGSAGGPVFSAAGEVVGISSTGDDKDDSRRGDSRVVPIADACEVLAAARQKMTGGGPPPGAALPVEPARPFPLEALKTAAERRAGSLNPYQMSSADFDLAFITSVLTYGAHYQTEQARTRERSSSPPVPERETPAARPLKNFSTWSEYVDEFPPVLLVRVTPRLIEGFWTTVARGAAMTQGVALPPIKRFKPGFARLQAFCGATEVTPIHPFTLEQRVSESDAIKEGLYVFDPGALGPQCGSVRLVLYSEKAPDKGDSRVVDPKVVQQVWQDFEPYRAAQQPPGA